MVPWWCLGGAGAAVLVGKASCLRPCPAAAGSTRLTRQAGRTPGAQGLRASCPGATGHGPEGNGGQSKALHHPRLAGVWLLHHGTHAISG